MDLNSILKQHDISLSEPQLSAFEKYADLLIEWNQKFNLTSITERSDIYLKHFYDSLLPAICFDVQGTLADVGSGAGFPGIPLKIFKPDLKVTLIEPTGKRCTFLKEVISQLNLKDIEVVNKRSEDYAREGHQFDIVTARAVAELNVLSELCLPLVKKGGHFIVMKGPKAYQEIENADNAIKTLAGKCVRTEEIRLDDEQTRVLIDIEKIKNHDAKYPRNYGQIKKKPL